MSMGTKPSVCALCQCHIKENTLFTDLSDGQLDAFKDVVVFFPYRKREFVFLEVNPSGQWGWIADFARLPIPEAVVEMLETL